MDFRQLRALIAVADHGTFSAAADALDTVQSNISTHIAKLESELSTQLIDRALNRLTPEGDSVVARARRISNEMDLISADLAVFRDEVKGEVHCGMIQTTGGWLLPHLMTQITRRYPEMYIRLTGGGTSTLEPLIASGVLDLAVIQAPSRWSEVVAEDLFDEEIVLVTPTSHPFATSKQLTVVDLRNTPMLLPTVGTAPRTELDAAARRLGTSLSAQAEIDGTEWAVMLAVKGQGPALVPATAVPLGRNDEDSTWTVKHVEDMPLRTVSLAKHRRNPLSPPSRVIRQLIFELLDEHIPQMRGVTLLPRNKG